MRYNYWGQVTRALISNEYESALNLGGRGLHAAVVAVSVGDHRPALAL